MSAPARSSTRSAGNPADNPAAPPARIPWHAQPIMQMVKIHLLPYWPMLALGMGANLAVAAATSLLPLTVKLASDTIFAVEESYWLWLLPAAAMLIMAARAAASFAAAMLMGIAARRMVASVQNQLFATLLRGKYSTAAQIHSGALAASFLNDAARLEQTIPTAAVNLSRDSLTIIGLYAAMLYLDWRMALVFAALFPLAWMILRRFGRRTRRAAHQGLVATSSFATRVAEMLNGLRVIKAYGGEDREAGRARSAIGEMVRHFYKTLRGRASAGPVMEILAGIAIAGILYYAAYAARGGYLTQGDFTGFITALLLLYQPLRACARFHAVLQEGHASAARILDVIESAQDPAQSDKGASLRVGKGEIRLENVHLAYANAGQKALNKALNGIDLVIPAGKTLALVGPSGGGKSTIFNLLLRFYQPDQGRIIIDGQDIASCSAVSVRAALAVVTQEPVIFADSIAANIAYGAPNASEDQIRDAAHKAGADNFISALPQAYQTNPGESGRTLSGGQRQRLAIARAILRNAPIILLDEPTSALDSESEQKIHQALRALMAGRTNIIIAHRLTTIIHADTIAVLDKGRIVEQGRHDQLLDAGGLYARLYRAQFASQPKEAAKEPVQQGAASL